MLNELEQAEGKLRRISELVGREPTTSLANRIRLILDEPSPGIEPD